MSRFPIQLVQDADIQPAVMNTRSHVVHSLLYTQNHKPFCTECGEVIGDGTQWEPCDKKVTCKNCLHPRHGNLVPDDGGCDWIMG